MVFSKSSLNRLTFKVGNISTEEKRAIISMLDVGEYKDEIWDWQFGEGSPYCIVAYLDKELVGFNGIMPMELKLERKVHLAYWSCDFVVADAYRGMGIGSRIKEKVLEYYKDSIISSFGISDAAFSVLLNKGWHSNNSTIELKRVTNDWSIKGLVKSFLQRVNQILYRYHYKIHEAENEFFISLQNSLPNPAEINILWNKISSDYECCVARNATFLKWRYEEIPINTGYYHFLVARSENNHIKAVLIFTDLGEAIKIVDYLGPKEDLELKNVLLQHLIRIYSSYSSFSFSTSDKQWINVAKANGFFTAKGRQRFVSIGLSQKYIQEWFLTSSDSDGDFLQIASLAKKPLSDSILWKFVDSLEFLNSRECWQNLLFQSHSDKLFMSWYWMNAWWSTWGETLRAKLKLVYIYHDSELISIIPLYQSICKVGPFKCKRIQFLGNSWNGLDTVRSEYLSPIVHKLYTNEVINQFPKILKALGDWDEFIWSDRVIDDQYVKDFTKVFDEEYMIGFKANDKGYSIDGFSYFKDYAGSLGPNTRKKLVLRRSSFESEYSGYYSKTTNSLDFFNYLNEFHISRWGKAVFGRNALNFHNKLAALFVNDPNYVVDYSYLKRNQDVLSTLYNVHAGSRTYNIQAGYLEYWNKKISLGTLHLGYSIEESIDQKKYTFDLLLGTGKNTDYKSRLAHKVTTSETTVFVKNKKLKIWYFTVGILRKLKHKFQIKF